MIEAELRANTFFLISPIGLLHVVMGGSCLPVRQTTILRHVFSHLVLFHVIHDIVHPSLLWHPPYSLSL